MRQGLLNTDILCLTETQLLPDQNTCHISSTLPDFKFCHSRSDDKYQSISFCYNSSVEMTQYYHSIDMSQIEFRKTSFSQHSIKLLIVYRKNNTYLTSFYEALAHIIQSEEIHIVLGDFNINAQDQCQSNA